MQNTLSPTILSGPPAVLGQGMQEAVHILANEPILVIDGSNRFRMDHLAKMARILHVPPHKVLKNVYLSRAFTCHQMTELICRRTYTALREKNSQHLILTGLLDTYYDENISFTEAKKLLERTIASLKRISKIAKLTIVQPQWHEISGPRTEFLNILNKEITHGPHPTLNQLAN
ncbi:hypothetical protein KKC88_05380 [Patescibacteria group bacterium]|nr:hypothetical protein [Patescibacteria group bacterium]MBU1673053.1 hypothetical protein [Patescibacteria group bacterium]MBU1963659.1 hypothetical protein [Patescibacteria group bacterium]